MATVSPRKVNAAVSDFLTTLLGVKLDLVCHAIYPTYTVLVRYIELTTCTLIFAKIRKNGSKIPKILNFSPYKYNGSKFSCAIGHVSQTGP